MFGIASSSKPKRADRLDADVDRAILRVRRLERREPPQPARRGRSTAARCGRGRAAARTSARAAARTRRRPRPPPGAARSRARAARSASRPRCARPRLARLRAPPSRSSRATSRSRRRSLKLASSSCDQLAELFALRVVRQDGELRLRGVQRQLLALERQPRREDRVLELVLARRELRVDDAALAGPAQPIEPLPLVRVGRRRPRPREARRAAAG